jgi:glycosyltransferase involved in cell wall biosynthesis
VVEEAGLVAEPGSVAGVLAAIRQLGNDEAERSRLGSAARRYAVDVLERERVLRGFEDELNNLLAARDDPSATVTARR